jgi:2-polyprenyl-6-methoxyphenol hydroxylase-like FAD-dependent oxidoreductase
VQFVVKWLLFVTAGDQNRDVRIACVGGGPAGLYFAILTKLHGPGHEITVLERDPAGTTYGWAVTLREALLEALSRQDPVSAEQVRRATVPWTGRVLQLPGQRTVRLPAGGYSIARATLLDILTRRALDLGVQVQHETAVTDRAQLGEVDLVVVADGANSRLRTAYADRFATRVDTGRNRYIWLGTEQTFDALVFALERTPAGPIWLHGYPAAAGVGTCVVEVTPTAWQGLNLDRADLPTIKASLETIFADVLGGRPLLTRSGHNPTGWRQFGHVTNTTWYHDNIVLLGDAAHTTHYSIGAGTREAIKDATCLAWCLDHFPDPAVALAEYDRQRRPAVEKTQVSARRKMAWCEDMDRHAQLDPAGFYAGLSGRGSRGLTGHRISLRGLTIR